MMDRTLSDEVIELEPSVDTFLGPNLQLVNCRVVSNAPANRIFFSGMEMIKGNFEQNVRLENFHFEKAHFRKVKFVGEYVGCDFGDWDDANISSVSECDFSEASVHECRFLNTDMGAIVLPAWPYFCLLNPADAHAMVHGATWPRVIRIALNVYTEIDPECSGIVCNAEILAKEAGLPLGELRQMFSSIPGFVVKGS